MRVVVSLLATLCLVAGSVRSASAGTISLSHFTGSGGSGVLDTTNITEPWIINCNGTDAGGKPCPTGDFAWGSPGVAAFITPYTGTTPAMDFEITFDGFNLDPTQLVSPSHGCDGMATGGTVFCGGQFDTPWTFAFDPTHPNSIAFFAPAGQSLAPNQQYFVNIFLVGTLPTPGTDGQPPAFSFSGDWTAETTPEPASLVLLGTGLVAAAAGLRKRRRSA